MDRPSARIDDARPGRAERPGRGYAYPRELAALVHARWAEPTASSHRRSAPPPDLETIEALLSICYQASLLHDEARPVTFRLALSEADDFPAAGGPPEGLQRLVLVPARRLDPQELRRLSAAATFHRSLIGVRPDRRGGFQIWGIIHSGTRWLQGSRGGRDVYQLIPDVLMVGAIGPGRLVVGRGTRTIAELSAGSVTGLFMDVLQAPWLFEVFRGLHEAQALAHEAARARATIPWARLDPTFGAQLARHALRRVVTRIRGTRHGGMLVLVPVEAVAATLDPGGAIELKYRFRDEEPRRRFLAISTEIMNELARAHAGSEAQVGWAEYEASTHPRLLALDEALFEVAHMIAALAGADGAVLLTDTLELLGFGGEIVDVGAGSSIVARAVDAEGVEQELVDTAGVGTRHRAAYRLCERIPGVIAIAVSQDGGLRFIRKRGETVTYWDQLANGPWET